MAVGVVGDDAELPRARLAESDGARARHATLDDGPVRLAAVFRGPVADPGQQGLIFGRADRQPPAAAVRRPAGRLGQEQALLGTSRDSRRWPPSRARAWKSPAGS